MFTSSLFFCMILYWTIIYASSSEDSSETGPYADLFTHEEYVEISQNKRIRREIRSLSCEEWNRVASAMNIMKHTSQSEGEKLYGSDYRSYDSFVCQHARATNHPLGDLAHLGPHFLVVHRAFVLAFENSLLAIDASISGAPYWNYYIDFLEYGNDMTDSVIFSDDYFGEFKGNDEFGYAVSNGKFKFWRINDDPNDLQCDASFRNAFGQLRQANNAENNEYVTRIGGNTCNGELVQWSATSSAYNDCLTNNDYSDITSFFNCMNFHVHAAAHFAVGGTHRAYENQIVDNWPSCVSWHAAGTTAVNNVRKFALNYGCFDCPESGDCIVGIDDISCAQCDVNENGGTCDIEGVSYTVSGDLDSQHIIGDFYDLSTSVNDAIFFAHHSNVDRYFMEWQLSQFDKKPYYDYPESGYETGVNLNDIMCDQYPFENLFNNNNEGPYTFADILTETDFVDAPYTYDTIIDLIKQDD